MKNSCYETAAEYARAEIAFQAETLIKLSRIRPHYVVTAYSRSSFEALVLTTQ